MKMRVYELSKQLDIPSKELLEVLKENDIEAKSHMSVLDENAIALLRKKFAPPSAPQPLKVPSERKEPMQKQQIGAQPAAPQAPKEPKPEKTFTTQSPVAKQKPIRKVQEEPVVPDSIQVQPMTVSDFAEAICKPVNDVILTLLKMKILAAKNKLLSEEVIEQLARHYEITPTKKREKVAELKSLHQIETTENLKERLPVVVVVGHVDHGKTTLLDYIRKTRVVAKEKGGITQHLGAYEAKTPHGNLVFIDTPGHEAFPKIRQRGIRVADIGVLVIAADDAIMPQTVEAIKLLKEMNVPIVVAINKIDKVEAPRIEVVKRQLAEHDLLPEEWGGQIICVPISALEGTNIDQLLEMIALQAQMMELRASFKGSARCYVLESRLQKGRGPVATLICQHGDLKIGDYFICGDTHGRVTSITNSAGENLDNAYPSIPVQVAGFKELPQAGDLFRVIEKDEVRKEERQQQDRKSTIAHKALHENALNLLVKADTNSSKEALVDAIEKLNRNAEKGFNIIFSGVGNISEGDIELAYSTGCSIVGLHVKPEANALSLAQRRDVSVARYDIIYKLLEDLQARDAKEKKIEMVKKKIGQAIVRRVFDIKGVGVVAGSYVQDGRFAKEGYVVAYRGRQKIGEGKITSLQRDKKTVKEVHTGFECGFVVDGITDWLKDDIAECYIEVPKE